ncbi:MAG: PQQ-binding-like beta-propeller repeat protein [Rhodopirellula sp.]|nr:PQQ-binding-like beta-propeller repeat protein [Rhodopirellula sp.]
MSDRHSDADLIRICLEGSIDELTEPVISMIGERISESSLLQAAVNESPIAAAINERLANSVTVGGISASPSPGGGSRRAGLTAAVVIAGLVAGVGLWWSNQREEDITKEDHFTETSQSIESEPTSLSHSFSDNVASEIKVAESSAASGSGKAASAEKSPVAQPESSVKDSPKTSNAGTRVAAASDAGHSPEAVSSSRPAGPWTDALSLETPARRFEEVAWQIPGTEHPDQFSPTEFQQWFSRLPGKPFQVGEENVSNRIFSNFSGIARLNGPLSEATVLRVGIYDTERCSLTMWSGNQGVELRYYRHRNPNVWGVYSVSRAGREGEDALPRVGRFLTSDCGRWHRSNFGIFDLRWDNGYLRMIRGDVVLLTVPLDDPPDEMILDGKLKLREVRMFRSDPLPEYVIQRSEGRPVQNILATSKPADLEWSTTDVPDGNFSMDKASGQVRLATKSNSEKRALAFVNVPKAGLSEVIFRMGSFDPGTGVYFGRPDGEQIFRISCVWDTAASKPALWFQSAGQHEVERRFDSEGYVVPWTGRDQWIRVVAGYGITTVQMSSDGRHWGWIIDNPSRTDWEHLETIGLFTEPKGDRQVQLSSISVNEFPALASVADPKLVAQIMVSDFGLLNVLDEGAWFQKMTRLQPAGVSFGDWRRACAVATLRARPRAPLGIFLLNGLLADGAFSEEAGRMSEDDRGWNLLNEASQLVSTLDSNRAVQFQQLYHELARRRVIDNNEQGRATRDGAEADSGPSGSVVRDTASRLLSSPMLMPQASALTAQGAAGLEVIGLLQSGRYDDTRQLIDEIIFWNSHAHPSRDWWSQVDPLYPSLAWAELQSHAGLDTETQTARLALPRRWKTVLTPERHPLAQPVSKEAYNVMAEFQAAVNGEAFQDACQVISSAGSAHLIGLLPDSLDDQLLVSFPNAVAMAMDRHPQLRQQMNERFGAIGSLRVRQAIENGDYRQVEAATIQFFGTPAAAESDLWLGDRAMSSGQFAQARSYFERAISGFHRNSQIETSEAASAKSRLQFVNALLGETHQQASVNDESRSVSFGSQQLSPQQFASLLTEVSESQTRQSSAGTSLSHLSAASDGRFDSPQIPQPVSHRIENRGRYEGDLGEHVGRSVPPDTDWVSRQLAWTIVGDRVFLNNRFQITCLDLTNGSQKWNQQLGGDHGSAHHWPMLAMRPLVSGDLVFCRRLTKSGTELVCCQMADGTIRWKQQFEQVLVSDPFLLRGHLQVLSTDQSSVGPTVLNLLTVHRETGNILSTAPILKLFDAWQNSLLVCQVAVQDANVFVSTAGAVACCNAQGQTLWVRRQEWTPTNLDTRYRYARSWSAPVIIGNQLIVGQPESSTIDSLNLQTGRLLWQHVEPELRRVISHDDKTMLVETRDGLKSISIETGQTLWLYAAADLLDGVAVGPLNHTAGKSSENHEQLVPSFILAIRHVPFQDGRSNTTIPTLVWIDARTGREIARQRLSSLADRESRVGPLLITKDRFFAFSGKDRKEGKRDIIELVPEPAQRLSSPIDQELLAAWSPEFLVSTFPDNFLARPNLTATLIQRDSRNGIDELCPGWLLIAPAQPGGMGKHDDHRGQKSVLELRLQPVRFAAEEQQAFADTPINAIRLVRDVFVPASGDQNFRFRAGNNSGQSWNLIVDVNGQQIHSTVISDETAPSGWAAIQTSLQRWAGSHVRVVITCSLADVTKQASIFLSELNSSTLARPNSVD